MAQNWRETKQGKKSQKDRGVDGCFGCLGILLALFAMAGVVAAAGVILANRGIDADVAFMYEGLFSSIIDVVGGLFLPLCIIAALTGLLVLYFSLRPSLKELREKIASIQGSTSAYDQETLAKHQRAKKRARIMVTVGGILFLSALLAPLLAAFGPALPNGIGDQLTQSEFYELFISLFTIGYFFGSILIFAAAFLITSSTVRFRSAVLSKEQVVYEELHKRFTDVLYYPQGNLSEQEVSGPRLLPRGNGFENNDCIRASYHGVAFSQADIRCTRTVETTSTDSDGHRTTSREVRWRFTGRWLTLYNMKNTSGPVYIYSKNFPTESIPASHRKNLARVEVEDTGFNREFDIFAQNGQDAFFVLTPRIIDKLKSLVGLSDNDEMLQGIALACVDGAYHFAVSGVADAFEWLFAASFSEAQVRERVQADIALIPDLIDTVL